MKLKDIQGMSTRQIVRLPESDKRDLYRQLRRTVSRRRSSFEKHGLKFRAPAGLRGDLAAPSKASVSAIDEALRAGVSYIDPQSSIYTASGYMRWEKAQRRELAESMGLPEMTDTDYRQYRQFMNDMAVRMKGSWQYVSTQAKQLYAEAKRLNLNPNQFRRNFDYWAKHVKDLADARPISRGSGVKPSDYIKQLKLESVTSWKNKNRT